jgi:hypothetical protein
MVNFSAKLASNIVVEWSEHYVDYNSLKKMLKRISRATSSSFIQSDSPTLAPETITPENAEVSQDNDEEVQVRLGLLSETVAAVRADEAALQQQLLTSGGGPAPRLRVRRWYGSLDSTISNAVKGHADRVKYESEYQTEFARQVLKVEAFYKEKLESLQASHDLIVESLDQREKFKLNVDPDADEESDNGALSKEALSADSIKRTCVIIYRKLTYLKNFAVINYTACVKISKKHDKMTSFQTKKQAMAMVNEQEFRQGKEVQALLDKLETHFADAFCGGDATVGRSELLMKHWAANDWQMLHIGLRIGVVLVLALWTLWDASMDASEQSMPTEVVRVYRGISCFVLAYWCWAATTYMWHSAHVNYVYLFELDPRHTLHYIQVSVEYHLAWHCHLQNVIVY